jgi:hypothetical protein
MLADATGDDQFALRHHQVFKEQFVARFTDQWAITASAVLQWAERERQPVH